MWAAIDGYQEITLHTTYQGRDYICLSPTGRHGNTRVQFQNACGSLRWHLAHSVSRSARRGAAMECFEDRSHAGRLLGQLLAPYRARADVVVLGLPRGGVPVAFEVATALEAPLDVMVVQKIGAPGVREFIVGAIAPGGVVALNDDALGPWLDTPDFRFGALREGVEMKRREALYRRKCAPLILSGRTVILVDDGAATGASMRAALRSARMSGAARVIVALGVAPKELLPVFRIEADDAVCALIAAHFCSVAQHYCNFSYVADEEITPRLHPARLPDYHKVPS